MTRDELIEKMAKAIAEAETGERLFTDWIEEAEAALFAIESSGITLVPNEPTKEMTFNGGIEYHKIKGTSDPYVAKKIYRTMISASPYRSRSE